ncbi:hypothetical protein APR50_01155 [Variovorax paradoxus]|jgi:two-component system OmpR family response regulator|uniref:response regulator n=1 Tax=Variovorax TaxID=34072 RepID=UPI0006E4B7BC|nr:MULTISPECIES: response regulator [unclassified Variovorax]KPU97917.1 hypothetical protein APR52_09570 [Variovorax paradoxus]KPV12191.1 hypothetical protein APR50_01155 [Variovorax paradoxus]KPV14093.1 hypothetical protein APR49_00715 [Variovorax paradoxus]KPV20421.1 hypothetical protein APR51_17005 [Variovorax paradoxus]KPV30456.1 hypothetical protein APR47_23945 [Variovorax paradoxus]
MSLNGYLVEDNPLIRDSLIATLEELAPVHMVGTAETQAEAVAWLHDADGQWDVAVVDLFLRHGTGFGVLMGCKDRLPRQRMVIFSNFATPDMRERAMLLGADAVFDKSTEIEGLLRFLEETERAADRT